MEDLITPYIDDEMLSDKLSIVTDEDICNIEKELSIEISGEIRSFLKVASCHTYPNMLLQSASKNAPGFLNIVKQTKRAWGVGVPKDSIVICQDNGNYHCFTGDLIVALWEHELEDFGEEWDDINDWMENEFIPRIS